MTDRAKPERPLAGVVPRHTEDSLVFEVGDKTVEIHGDTDLIVVVLSYCDGTRESAEISALSGRPVAEVDECIALLAEHNLVLPADEAYLHLHTLSKVSSPLLVPRSSAEIESLMTSPRWRPEPGTRLPLCGANRPGAERRSATQALGAPSFEELSSLLQAAYGAQGDGHLAVPSAGALYPLILHSLLGSRVGAAKPGTWWFDWEGSELHAVEGAEIDLGLAFLNDPFAMEILSAGPAVILISADASRSARKYGPRAYGYVLLEAGAVMQAIYTKAGTLGLGVRAIGGIDGQLLHRTLCLPPGALVLLAMVVGHEQ